MGAWQTLAAVISLLVGMCTILGFGLKMIDRRMAQRQADAVAAKTDGIKEGTLVIQLDTITTNQGITLKKLDDMCEEQKRQALQSVKDVTELRGEINLVKDYADSAHHRITGLEGKVEKLSDKVFATAQEKQ